MNYIKQYNYIIDKSDLNKYKYGYVDYILKNTNNYNTLNYKFYS